MAIKGCLLVGSVPLADTQAVLRRCGQDLRGLLMRMPDGETGSRNYFVKFQASKFPTIVRSRFLDNTQAMRLPLTDEQLARGRREVEEMDLNTGYDDAAIESYSVFKQLQFEGVIEKDVKFQVSLPTIANVVGILIEEDFRPLVELVYEKALFKSLRKIQDMIPHEDLAIQIDLGMDMAYWENKVFQPWFSDKGHIVEYIVRMMSCIDKDVDLGLHYCYGDMEHKHFVEPSSLGPIADLHQRIVKKKKSARSIQWIHCPVPLSAMGKLDDFFEPLSMLKHLLSQDKTKLYLGLVHPYDLEGTQRRITAARKVVEDFGVATECGWGRASNQEEIDSIIDICRKVSCRHGDESSEGNELQDMRLAES